MPGVESQHLGRAVPFSQHHERRVCQADTEVGETLQDRHGTSDIVSTERLEPLRTPRHILEQRGLGRRTHMARQQVVELRQHER